MSDIRDVELIVIAEGKETEKGNSWKLRLVQWVVDGESKSVKLEKRRFFRDDYGNKKTGKADGLRLDDLQACKPHWAKIMEFMKTPPAVKEPEPELQEAVDAAKEVFPGSKEVDGDIPF